MNSDLPDPNKIANRLYYAYAQISPRRKLRCLFLSQAQLREFSGRSRIESTVLRSIMDRLFGRGLHMAPIANGYLLLDEAMLDSFDDIPAKTVRTLIKQADQAPFIPSAFTALDPQATWPFPTAAHP